MVFFVEGPLEVLVELEHELALLLLAHKILEHQEVGLKVVAELGREPGAVHEPAVHGHVDQLATPAF